jgi:hypothetical protein
MKATYVKGRVKDTLKFVLKKLGRVIAIASPRVLVALLVAIHVIVVAILAVPELNRLAIFSASSLGHFAWSQLSSPSPPTPAGNITMDVIRIWSNHFLEVEVPRALDFARGRSGIVAA